LTRLLLYKHEHTKSIIVIWYNVVMNGEVQPVRGVILWTLVLCLGVAMAPWMSGGQDALAGFLTAGALLLGFLLLQRQPTVRLGVGRVLVAAYLALLGWGALSLLWTANAYSTVLWLVMMVTAGLAFRLSYAIAGMQGAREKLLGLYVATVVAVCVYGFWFYLTVPYERFVSSFYWPNPVAAYLVPAVLLGLWNLGKAGRWQWWWGGFLAIVGTAFVLAGSRGTAVVLALAVGVLLLLKRWGRRFWVLFVFSVLAAALASAGLAFWHQKLHTGVTTTTLATRITEVAAGSSQSGSDRMIFLQGAIEMWWERPLWGVGAGAYGDVHPRYQHRVVSASVSAHNFYVQLLAELGLVGIVLLAWVLLALVGGVIWGLVRLGPVAVVPALSWMALMVHFGIDMDQRYPALVVLTAVLAGLAYAGKTKAWGRLSWRPVVLAVALLPVALSLYMSVIWYERGRNSLMDANYSLATEQFAEASRWPVYNPDAIGAEAIGLYSVAAMEPARRKQLLVEALERAEQAISQDRADAQHYQIKGRILALQNRLPEAKAALIQALELDPYNHPEYAWDLANVYHRLDQPDEGVAVAQKMLDQYTIAVIFNRWADKSVPVHVANLWAYVGNVALAKGDVAGAKLAASKALTVDHHNLRGRALQVQAGRQ
jgi:putative inorganic carbon (hco3(-)) transporter